MPKLRFFFFFSYRPIVLQRGGVSNKGRGLASSRDSVSASVSERHLVLHIGPQKLSKPILANFGILDISPKYAQHIKVHVKFRRSELEYHIHTLTLQLPRIVALLCLIFSDILYLIFSDILCLLFGDILSRTLWRCIK